MREYIFECLLEMAKDTPLRNLTKILIDLNIPEIKRELVREIIERCYQIITQEECDELKCVDQAVKEIKELGGDVE